MDKVNIDRGDRIMYDVTVFDNILVMLLELFGALFVVDVAVHTFRSGTMR